jgi:PAS domain S-box-containing protein
VAEPQPSREQLESELHFLRQQVEHLQRAAASGGQLRSSESDVRRAAILHSALDCIVSVDQRGRIVEFNPAAEATFGYRAADVLGRPISECIVPPSLRAAHEAGFALYMQTGHGPVLNRRIEITAMRASGEEFPVELAITPFRIGEERLFTAYIRDLTERRRQEDALRASQSALQQAQKMEAVGKLAGGIAHDFNNLLTVIVGYCELLEDGCRQPETVLATAAEIRRAGERAASLTRQLLAFSRKQRLELVAVNVNAVVLDTERLLRRVIGETIELRHDLDPALCPVRADVLQLEQVLINLVVNAKDAMPRGGHITVRTRSVELAARAGSAPERRCVLEVVDNGLGMSDEVKQHLFEPFYTTKRVGEGTGLGLAMVYGVVQQCGGTIEVESELGKGSLFRITLPATDESPTERAQREGRLGATMGEGTVLLVEDEELVRGLVRQILQAQGYTVLVAPHGPGALAHEQVHAKEPIHLLVTDVVMPQMDGPTLVRTLRERRPDLPALFISGYSEPSTPIALPRSSYLQKPFSPTQFTRAVQDALAAARASIPG